MHPTEQQLQWPGTHVPHMVPAGHPQPPQVTIPNPLSQQKQPGFGQPGPGPGDTVVVVQLGLSVVVVVVPGPGVVVQMGGAGVVP
jgi:hypothetical protein